MTTGFSPAPAGASASAGRRLEPEDWSSIGVALLRDPRQVVTDLHSRHLPSVGMVVVGVLDPDQHTVASASFSPRQGANDGWEHRNALLWHLRRIVPHDLRRRIPVRSGVLLVCREGEGGWTEADGAWMWGLRDACVLHGLRCGAYVTLTAQGWHVLGDGRSGRNPHAGSWAPRAADGAALRPVTGAMGAARRTAAR
ncbi:hypothetical protein AQ490_01450 [Wenjunlia vitaminophila]|uniref:Uncharacterized protein n=1 Tax=Wenjunlia vitaminophila TaxID=76728 RepID=A0A0T6LZP5_WENVI|nr:hypothetical protein [Wenjunlia vitaminophila]KRV51449.1 hypothetical protein AQ490_01450 [Wenjunlia vitaminophila]